MISREEWEAQVDHATEAYMEGGDEDVQEDLDARVSLAAESHEEIDNDELGDVE